MDYNTQHTLSVDFTLLTQQDESDEMISCFIPEINARFSAKTEKEAFDRGVKMVKGFIKYFKNESL